MLKDRKETHDAYHAAHLLTVVDNMKAGEYVDNIVLRDVLLNTLNVSYECHNCESKPFWDDKLLTLELDHIDGNGLNCHPDNLRFLCPNCHSQTPTYRGGNKNTRNRTITDEQFKEALASTPNIRQALLSLGLAPKGNNYTRANMIRSQMTS
tara:strand:- start:30 stop:485 length:456 start_codon:yes stop_codon:yes gene_type:complete